MGSEVTLNEVLSEPIIRLLMHRDGVKAHEVRALVKTLRRRITANDDRPIRQIADAGCQTTLSAILPP